MHVLFLSQFFTAPNQPGISRAWMIARFFGSKGHKVSVIASRTDYMTGKNFKQKDKANSDDLELPEGVTVKKINTILKGKSKIKRLLQYIIYCLSALLYGLREHKPVVLATSPPIFVGLIGCWLAKLRGAKFVFEIRDPWPDALIYFGVLKESLFTKFLFWLEFYIYKNAHLLVALTPGIKRLIVKKGIEPDKIVVIPNGYDKEFFEKNGELIYPRQKKKGTETKVIYVGSLGKINETEYMMDTVTLLKNIPDIKFEIIGEGICKKNMMKTARERDLKNVIFLPPVPREKVPEVLSTGDIAFLFTRPGLYSEIGLHNKIFDYLGEGLPVVVTGGGDLKDLIERAGAGYTLKPRDVEGVAEKIKKLHFEKELAWQMGDRGRKYILKYYSRELLLAAYEEAVKRLVLNIRKESVG